MSGFDRRAVLEAVAFGEDDRVRPADRLRAVELLLALGEVDRTLAEEFELEVARMSPEEIDEGLDMVLSVVVGELAAGTS